MPHSLSQKTSKIVQFAITFIHYNYVNKTTDIKHGYKFFGHFQKVFSYKNVSQKTLTSIQVPYTQKYAKTVFCS